MNKKSVLMLATLVLFSISSNAIEPIKGTKRFRPVLDGVLYFGGGNQLKQRDNRNPLLNSTLDRMCGAGFSEAIYVYERNKSKMRRNTSCGAGSLKYDSISWLKIDQFMGRIHNNIVTQKGPMYIHCFNGVHASNAISVIAKMQFCGLSSKDAEKLWLTQTDDYGRKEYAKGKFNSVRKRIKRYKFNPNLSIPDSIKNQICN